MSDSPPIAITTAVALEARDGGVVLPVRATPRARRDGVVGVHDGRLRVAVTSAPERGKANEHVVRVLARALDLPRARIALLAGASAHDKRFWIEGETVASVAARLRACLPEAERAAAD